MYASDEERLIPGQDKPRFLVVVAIIAAVALLAAIVWYFASDDSEHDELLEDRYALDSDTGPGTVQREEEVEPTVEPAPLLEPFELDSGYVFPEPIPDLDASDAELLEQLGPLSASDEPANWAPSEDLARKLTAVAYSLADGEVAYEYMSLPAPEGKFKVASKGKKTYINSDNYARYDVFVNAVQALDVDHAVAFYLHYWPLLRTAFAELGEADKSLQSEVMTAIDLLLETPDVDGDIELIRPSVYYKFADKELENLKPAQKLMLRMGPENRAAIKEKLAEFKAKLSFDDAQDAADQNAAAPSETDPDQPTEGDSN